MSRASFYHPKPDIVEILIAAKPRIFVSLNENQHAMISALRNTLCVTRFQVGSSEPIAVHYSDCTAQQLDLFDGRGWNVPALAIWIRMHCPVCWGPLRSGRATYCSGACKQKALRARQRSR